MNNKLEGYYKQDKIKGRLHYVFFHEIERYIEQNITIKELLKLIESDGLTCYLCNKDVYICCKAYSGNQFTLDRINNNLNHSVDNVKICCLTCNILKSNKYSSNEFKNTFF